MSTGWRYIFSDGEVFKSQLQALLYLKNNPSLTVEFSELSMGGEKRTDVTKRFKAILDDTRYGSER